MMSSQHLTEDADALLSQPDDWYNQMHPIVPGIQR